MKPTISYFGSYQSHAHHYLFYSNRHHHSDTSMTVYDARAPIVGIGGMGHRSASQCHHRLSARSLSLDVSGGEEHGAIHMAVVPQMG